jgi:hypothetical protein
VSVCDIVQNSELRVNERNSSGGSTRTERSGTKVTEEYKRLACEDLRYDWKILCVILVFTVA